MIQGATRNMILPAFIATAVLLIAFTLLSIVARSPYTHSNLNAGYDPNYTRTEQIVVGPPIPVAAGMLAVTPASDLVEHGKQLFVADGCASCHGLDGRGGIVGPPIVGMKAVKLRAVTSVGPKGMLPYAPGALSDPDLAAIAAFLNAGTK